MGKVFWDTLYMCHFSVTYKSDISIISVPFQWNRIHISVSVLAQLHFKRSSITSQLYLTISVTSHHAMIPMYFKQVFFFLQEQFGCYNQNAPAPRKISHLIKWAVCILGVALKLLLLNSHNIHFKAQWSQTHLNHTSVLYQSYVSELSMKSKSHLSDITVTAVFHPSQ